MTLSYCMVDEFEIIFTEVKRYGNSFVNRYGQLVQVGSFGMYLYPCFFSFLSHQRISNGDHEQAEIK